jgi:hypothetical protein
MAGPSGQAGSGVASGLMGVLLIVSIAIMATQCQRQVTRTPVPSPTATVTVTVPGRESK